MTPDIAPYIEHIKYEIDMLEKCKSHWNNTQTDQSLVLDNFKKNILIECYLLHYRNLAFFLENPKDNGSYKDDLNYQGLKLLMPNDFDKLEQARDDFWAYFDYKDKSSPLDDLTLKETIHKKLAHLTTQRSNKLNWDIDGMHREIMKCLMYIKRSYSESQ
jgi:hypothetical protein